MLRVAEALRFGRVALTGWRPNLWNCSKLTCSTLCLRWPVEGNRQLLRLLGLPIFETPTELSELVHVSSSRIWLYVKYASSGSYYRHYRIPKASGDWRDIYQPGRELKAVQAWILRRVLDKLTVSPHATAYVRGRGLRDNVVPHSANRYFLCLDIEDFFPSIGKSPVKRLFALLGYSERAADILANLCTCRRTLPQGGVTSPALANLVAAKLDRRIAGLAAKRNIAYTRYSDDITLSSNSPAALTKAMPIVLEIIRSERFAVNKEKVRCLGPRRQCKITGLVKNSSASEFGIGRAKKRSMRAAIFNLLTRRICGSEYSSEASILGWLSFLRSVDESGWNQMRDYYERVKQRA